MKLKPCFLAWFFLLANPVYSFANNPRALGRQPAPGKAFYTVIPKDGIDASQTASYIKTTVGADDLQPWTDVHDKLLSWTVEATAEEIGQLKSHSGIDHINKLDAPVKSKLKARQGGANTEGQDSYMVYPVDGKNRQQTDATDAALRGFLQDRIRRPHIANDEVRFWVAQMNGAEVDRASGIDGVDAVEPNAPLEPDFIIPKAPQPQPSALAKLSDALHKREISYATQENAVTELVAISQPSSIPNVDNLKNYVYESHNGEGTWVYHLEMGVSFKDQSAEFPNVVPDGEHLRTEFAEDTDMQPWKDPSDNSHGTCTAGKAVGQRFGVSKKSKLVVVQLYATRLDQILEGLDLIAADIRAKPERRKKSVVTMSLGNARDVKDRSVREFAAAINTLFSLDVPYVISSGNNAQENGRANVDTQPGLLEGPDMPIIVVGSVNNKGEKSGFSQSGPHVVVHAVGDRGDCLAKSGPDPFHPSGTSLSAPQVAGEIANLLGYETVPFDTSDGNLVRNLRDYLKSDSGSWERTQGIRTLWNGVKKENNPETAGQTGPVEPPLPQGEVKCHGLDSKKYVGRDAVKDVIENKFCPEAVKQGVLDKDSGSIQRNYNEGTLEAVSISMDWQPGLDFKPNQDDCVKFLLAAVDGCDGNNPQGNPENYKGGGTTADGKILYHVDPKADRQPAVDGKKAGCDSTYKALWNEYWVWGHGFASGDYGESLKKEVKGCALLPDTWSFDYGLGDDGREWTAKFRTGVFQKKCVGHAVGTAGGIANFGCSGSG